MILFMVIFMAAWWACGIAGSYFWLRFVHGPGSNPSFWAWMLEVTLATIMTITCGPIWLMYAYPEWKYDRDFWEGRF